MQKYLLLLALVTSFNICCASSEAPAPVDAARMAELDAELPTLLKSLTAQPAEVVGSQITLRTPTEDYIKALESMCSETIREVYEIGPTPFRYYLISELRTSKSTKNYIQNMFEPGQLLDPKKVLDPEELAFDIKMKTMLSKFCHEAESVLYMIFDNEHNIVIGYVTIRGYDLYNCGQLGIWINECYQGHGRGIEAIKLISQAYFDVYPSETSFTGYATLSNHKSYRTMRNAGGIDGGDVCTYDGTQARKVIFPNPTPRS